MDNAEFWKVVGQSAGLRADGVVAPVVVQFDRLDTNLEYLSRFRAANGDGPGEDVGAAELRLRPGVNRSQRVRYMESPNPVSASVAARRRRSRSSRSRRVDDDVGL